MRGLPYMHIYWNRYFKHNLRAKRSGQKRECRDDVRRAVHYTFRLIPNRMDWKQVYFSQNAKCYFNGKKHDSNGYLDS